MSNHRLVYNNRISRLQEREETMKKVKADARELIELLDKESDKLITDFVRRYAEKYTDTYTFEYDGINTHINKFVKNMSSDYHFTVRFVKRDSVGTELWQYIENDFQKKDVPYIINKSVLDYFIFKFEEYLTDNQIHFKKQHNKFEGQERFIDYELSLYKGAMEDEINKNCGCCKK